MDVVLAFSAWAIAACVTHQLAKSGGTDTTPAISLGAPTVIGLSPVLSKVPMSIEPPIQAVAAFTTIGRTVVAQTLGTSNCHDRSGTRNRPRRTPRAFCLPSAVDPVAPNKLLCLLWSTFVNIVAASADPGNRLVTSDRCRLSRCLYLDLHFRDDPLRWGRRTGHLGWG